MSWKKPASYAGAAVVAPVTFTPEQRAEIEAALGDAPDGLMADLEWIAGWYVSMPDRPTPGSQRNYLARLERLATQASTDSGKAAELGRMMRTGDVSAHDKLAVEAWRITKRVGVPQELMTTLPTDPDNMLPALAEACRRVAAAIPTAGRPPERDLFWLAKLTAECLREHGKNATAWFAPDLEQTSPFVAALTLVFEAAGEPRGADAVLRFARKAVSD